MNNFENNIINIFKEKGKIWLFDLPNLVKKAADNWKLHSLIPISDLTYNYVLSGFQNDTPIILKLSPNFEWLSIETETLKAFSGYGVVNIIAADNHGLLLERVVPGTSLNSYLPDQKNEALQIICNIMQKLHHAPLPENKRFHHIGEWLLQLDKEWQLPKIYLSKARELKNKLLTSSHKLKLLHGDLHHGNILIAGDEFKVIDPKGIIGYSINEVWAFIIDPITDTIIVADYFKFNLQEVREWYFVHIILSACWDLQDARDPKKFLKLAEITYPLIKD
jgi:streptomycin 6-kinase